MRIHWAELGTASVHAPVVLLHGLTDSHLTWQPVAHELARDRLVLLPDLPGCGLSSRPDASYELQWHSHVMALWLAQRELAEIDLVGHSFGGGVAQMLLLECPKRLRRLVLVASGGLGRDVGFWLKFATFPHFVEHYGQPFMAFGTRHMLGHASDERGRRDIEALSVMNSKAGTARAFARTVRDVVDFRGQTQLFLPRAHEILLFPPVAVLWGERDAIIPIAHGRDFTNHMEGVRFQAFADCGHYVHQEDRAGFVTAVRDFLDDPGAAPVRLRPALVVKRGAAVLARKALASVAQRFRPSSNLQPRD